MAARWFDGDLDRVREISATPRELSTYRPVRRRGLLGATLRLLRGRRPASCTPECDHPLDQPCTATETEPFPPSWRHP